MKNYSCVYSAQADIEGVKLIKIETDISNGLHAFNVIGLTDKAVDESRDRVGAAIKNSGLTSPKTQNQKVTISLAPADIKKEGPVFDLGIALSYLLASKQIEFNPTGVVFLGELSLSGEVQKVKGILPIALAMKKNSIRTLYVPIENIAEASLVDGIDVYGIHSLSELVSHIDILKKDEDRKILSASPQTELKKEDEKNVIDFGEIKGQESAKRALLIAGSGGHNIALYGPPGTGKTMLARAFRGILPELSLTETFEVASIHSIAGILRDQITSTPPFRSPHHTSSPVAVVGGGSTPKPGEITLAHRGVLFMDEFPEFDKRVLESLREPLEEGYISIARAKGRALFPADFILVAALNPCPCGNKGNPNKRCICSAHDIDRYTRKLSGPIMDRIDMWVEVSNIPYDELHSVPLCNNESELYRTKIIKARDSQRKRNSAINNKTLNSSLTTKDIDNVITLSDDIKKTLQVSAEKLALSPRSYYKIIKLARTIADIEGSEDVGLAHVLEALQYRPRI